MHRYLVILILCCFSMNTAHADITLSTPELIGIADALPAALPDGFLPYTKNVKQFKKPISSYNANNAAALNQINFNVTVAVETNSPYNLPLPKHFDSAIPIFGTDPNTGNSALFAYIFVSSKLNMIILSFSGTATPSNVLSDLDFMQVFPAGINNITADMLVHQGFYKVYIAVQQAITSQLNVLDKHKSTQFIITGYSLGGGLTSLAALDLADRLPIVYSFASPRVGNPAFAKSYNSLKSLSNTWRVFNTEDIVIDLSTPLVPTNLDLMEPISPFDLLYELVTGFTVDGQPVPLSVFEHVGNPAPFTLNLGSVLQNHINAYSMVINNQMQPDNPNGVCPNRYCSEKQSKKKRSHHNWYK